MENFWMMFDNYDKKMELNIGRPSREEKCTREDIESCLAQMQYDETRMSLEYLSEEGNHRLDIDFENGLYRILYFDEKGDYSIYWNKDRPKELIEYAGEMISNREMCDDFNIVKEAVRQFIENKTVSDELLNWPPGK